MQRWEYLYATIKWSEEDLKAHYPERWKELMSVERYKREAREEGWELVSYNPIVFSQPSLHLPISISTHHYDMVFKRLLGVF